MIVVVMLLHRLQSAARRAYKKKSHQNLTQL